LKFQWACEVHDVTEYDVKTSLNLSVEISRSLIIFSKLLEHVHHSLNWNHENLKTQLSESIYANLGPIDPNIHQYLVNNTNST